MLSPGGLSSSYSETYGVSEPTTYAEWMAEVSALVESLELPNEDCGGTECKTTLEKSPEPTEDPFTSDNLTLDATLARYRFGTPEGYDRSVWEMGLDEVTASQEWWDWYNAGATGIEPAPGPSLVAHRSWTWDGMTDWSDWYQISLPGDNGEARVANVLVICYNSTRIGVLPTAYGDQIALPE